HDRVRQTGAPVQNADNQPGRRRHGATTREETVRRVGRSGRVFVAADDWPQYGVEETREGVEVSARQRAGVRGVEISARAAAEVHAELGFAVIRSAAAIE